MVSSWILAAFLSAGAALGFGAGRLGRLPVIWVTPGLLGATTACGLLGVWWLGATLLGASMGLSMSKAHWTRRRKISLSVILLVGAACFSRLSRGRVTSQELTLGLAVVAVMLGVAAPTAVGKRSRIILIATGVILVISYSVFRPALWISVACVGVTLAIAYSSICESRSCA